MKNSIIILVALVTLASCTQENIRVSDDLTATEYEFTDIDGIDISGEFNVMIDLTNSDFGVKTEFNKELQSKISVENNNGTLKVYYNQSVNASGNVKNTIYLTTAMINKLRGTGEVNISVNGNIATTKLDIDLTGESKMVSLVNVNQLNVKLSGESDVNLSGRATNTVAEMAGESYLTDYGLVVDDVRVSMAGESNVKLSVEGSIDVSAAGESTFRYMGNATFTNRSVSGESKVIKVG